jgi:hypothetical protein
MEFFAPVRTMEERVQTGRLIGFQCFAAKLRLCPRKYFETRHCGTLFASANSDLSLHGAPQRMQDLISAMVSEYL